MTEPQPWPTTVQRRREAGDADPGPGAGAAVSAPQEHGSGDPASEIPTPRHGNPADRPVTAGRVPSPFPRQRDAGPSPDPAPSQAGPDAARQYDAGEPYPRLPRPAPQVPRQPSPDARQDADQPRPTHVRDLVGPRAARSAPAAPATTVVVRDSGAMTALRVVTYVLVSLASLVFLAFVVYGGIRYVQLRDTLSTSPFGSLSSSSPGSGTPAICVTDPTSEACANY
ncbi:hypothetical protein EV383_5682 [Pseudonocardia sediminis]|uniref:Uncharacterized protein n=1 Tax=Pseudonocardia sediminis TaxID=1397368 RepID=A0A4Q7V2F1_PSEST|nr:hypothetical protein [Pseudonocardia sediminis]RZT88737.1 hypothetical protein EV383_5682 [Pseudonocardia sediminis]